MKNSTVDYTYLRISSTTSFHVTTGEHIHSPPSTAGCPPVALAAVQAYGIDMKVLAIDPGYDRCGVAVIEKNTRELQKKELLLYSGCITTKKSDVFEKRLFTVGHTCKDLIEQYTPDVVALEKVYFSKNQKTALKIAEIRGALMYIATAAHIPVREYSPSEVKVAITSSGNADKRQVAQMVHALITIRKKIKYDDEYDAVALGLTCLSHTVATER
ncbi:MAG TPA: crossover junction endodeoxyribonuclease RuvC [Candidatus Paceibacterota bacterium]